MDGYDIRGADLCKFYVRPLNSHCKPGDILLEPDEDVEFTTCHPFYKSPKQEQFVSKSIQTDYRESECQTDPWDPPYRITKVYDDPEVLALSKLSYGNGLPAGVLEVKYASEKRENKNAKRELEANITDECHARHKQILCDQVRSEWKYRLAIENEKLNKKLSRMESSIIEDFQKYADKKEVCLKNMWKHRKEEISKINCKLQQKFHRELKALEADNKESNNIEIHLRDASSFEKNQRKLAEGLDYAFSNYYLSQPMGLTTVKSWLEKKTGGLTTKIPLIRKTKRTTREKMAEEAYQNILDVGVD